MQLIGVDRKVRERFATFEVDGEMLTLLELEDMQDDMRLLELTDQAGVIALLLEITRLKEAHGI